MQAPVQSVVATPLQGMHRAVGRRGELAAAWRAVTALLGAFGDGVLLGLAVAYVIGVGLTVDAAHLGLGVFGPLVAMALAAGLLAGITALLAGLLVVVRRLARAATQAIEPRLRSRRLAGIAALPLRPLAALSPRPIAQIAAFVLIGTAIPEESPGRLLLPAGLLLVPMAVAAATAGLLNVAWVGRRRPGRLARLLVAGATALAVAVAGGAAAWALWPGAGYGGPAPAHGRPGSVAIEAPDPAMPGPYAVVTTSYGSGTDRHRPAFGSDVAIRTPTVSAPRSLPRYPGLMDDAYRAFWGFGFDALPLNALVWRPAGEGPFPLVLVVHGNHTMGEFSEAGYAYLAEGLASHGMVVASIDENFLNGGFAGEPKGREMATRAWLLLLHLDLWRTWNADPSSPFHGLVDLDRVGLVGHSRGGEAASVAVAFSQLDGPPVPDMSPWPTGLRIRSVVSIAPSDGQFGGGTNRVRSASFLTLTGGLDGDAMAWSGARQYARAEPPDDGFKAAVWIERANHGQFNTVWGASDHGPLAAWLVDRAAIMDPAVQQRLARLYVGGFLAATLQDRQAYRDLFRVPSAALGWLPDERIIVRSSDGGFEPLLDPSRPREALLPGVSLATSNAPDPVVLDLPLRALQPTQQNRVHVLRWDAGPGDAALTLTLQPGLTGGLTARSRLQLSVADGRADGAAGVLDPVLVVRTRDGREVALPLSRWAPLAPPLPTDLYKHEPLAELLGIGPGLRTRTERVLQTWSIPLADLEAVDPAIEPRRINGISIQVARSGPGALYVDEVGFADD